MKMSRFSAIVAMACCLIGSMSVGRAADIVETAVGAGNFKTLAAALTAAVPTVTLAAATLAAALAPALAAATLAAALAAATLTAAALSAAHPTGGSDCARRHCHLHHRR